MYLKALEIQGFKSFPDRTKISFDRGITAVVGPNGSGKSNISDAIRWVLGETSVKQLRGGGKMENVIFGGTATRNAMGYTSVSLVLDNTDRRLDIDNDEVAIGRKYYRSGESEYSINGNSVRLRDVYELLLDTGLGRDGYSIIGQGRIAEIVGNKSTERREIFEEASGIARFRYRKNDAERRLAVAEENLIRLRDILGELEARVGPLEKESARAKQFLEYSSEQKSLEITLWVDTLHATREGLRGQQRKIEAAEADYNKKEAEIEALDAETLGIRGQIERLAIEIEAQTAGIRRLQEEIAGHDSQVAVTQNTIQNNSQRIEELTAEIARSGESAGEIEEEIKLQQADIKRAEEALAETNQKVALLEAQLTEIQEKSLATGERRGQVTARLAEATERITAVRVSEAGAASAIESAEARLATEQQSLDTVRADLETLEKQQAETADYLKTTSEEITKLENIKGGLEMKLAARQKALSEADEAERAIQRQAESAAQRVQMLKDLERNLDGFQQSVKTVVKAARDGKLRGIIGPVSTILGVEPGYEVAVETALGYAMQNVVVQDEAAAKAAMAHLKQTNGGRATFLPLDTVKPQKMDASRLPAGAVSAQSLVRYDAKYENIAASLLARIVVVEDINEASRTARSLDFRNRVVTRDGQVINAGGSFTGGSVSRSVGMFSRKQEIEDLEAKLKSLDAKQSAAEELTDKLNTEVEALKAELTATNSEAITAGGDKIRCETELSRINQSMQAARANHQRLATECDTQQEKIAEAKTELALAQSEQKRLSVEIDKLSAELSAISGDDDGFLAEREKLSEQLSALKLAAMGHENDAALHRQRIETLNSRDSESAAQRRALQANIERLAAENENHQKSIEMAGAGRDERRAQIEAIEAKLAGMRAERDQKEASIRGQTTRERAISEERMELGKEIARLNEQKANMELRYDDTVAQLWEQYNLTPTDAESQCVEIGGEGAPIQTIADLRRRVVELKSKIRAMGSVNVGAIEEFAEVSERYNTLRAQTEDVEKSKQSLEKMIAELSAEMTAMFQQSFAEINRHFGRIFNELFGGGKASLSLTDPEDILESGIEIEVAPPGKIIKDLSALSGGEQALVAICIYFAILAVNPAPFCVLDEIEAALDDANITRFALYLRRISGRTQFITITHRRGTMEEADVLYGVTMQEDGVSKLLRLNVAEVDASLVR